MRLAAFVLAALLFCSAAEAQPASYRILGRYAEDHGALSFAWPASGIEGRFRGTRLVVRIQDSGDAIMDVAIDGASHQLHLRAGVHDYVLFNSRHAAAHTIRLTRRSEIGADVTSIRRVRLSGSWRTLNAHAHHMLFIGDSITVGYGAAGADETCHYSAETSPPWDSYASRAAQAFDADFETLAISGRGVVRNYNGEGGPHMPALLDAALPDHPELPWDAALFTPDLIVINLGANDFSTADPGPSFEPAYSAMLATLRTRFPGAHIIAAFGPEPRTQDAIPRIQALVARVNGTQTRPVTFVYLPRAESGRIYGCDWHPGLDTHHVMAEALAAQITQDLGWTHRAIR